MDQGIYPTLQSLQTASELWISNSLPSTFNKQTTGQYLEMIIKIYNFIKTILGQLISGQDTSD
ncbi:MAG: hypothetical protein RLP12_14585 [Ekhidna sp.]